LPSVGSYSRFVSGGPGQLKILNTDGTATTLLDGNTPDATYHLLDFSAPAVSYDGTRIIFAATASLPGGLPPQNIADPGATPGVWRIYQINADGSSLTQLTFSDRSISLTQFSATLQAAFTPYDDTDPQYLPDGRIVFSSTRYPETNEYSGGLSTNLFVINSDGSNMHRITSEKSGADRAMVDPVTGQIVFSRWWRNNHYATNPMTDILCSTQSSDCDAGYPNDANLYIQHNGLTFNTTTDSSGVFQGLNTNTWQVDAINPDGTGLHMFSGAGRSQTTGNLAYGVWIPG